MSNEVKVVGVEFDDTINDIGLAVSKSLPSHYRYRYFVKKQLKLENGVIIHSTAQALTKPKLKKKIEDTKRNVEEGCVYASQYDGVWHAFTRMVIRLR